MGHPGGEALGFLALLGRSGVRSSLVLWGPSPRGVKGRQVWFGFPVWRHPYLDSAGV